MNSPDVSILIPALNEERNIARAIRSIQQHFPKRHTFEIIVADHGSDDRTADLSLSLGAKVIPVSGGAVSSLRNKLLSAATGKVLIYNDADVFFTPAWGVRAGQLLDEFPGGIVGGVLVPPDDSNWILNSWFWPLSRRSKTYVGTGHLWVERSLLQSVGGFDERLSTGEDVDVCLRIERIGGRVQIDSGLIVIHNDYPSSLGQFWRREVWHGTGDWSSLRRFFQSRVAMASLLFSALVMVSFFVFFNSRLHSLVVFLFSLIIPLSLSVSRFPKLSFSGRMQNFFLWSVYLLARTGSAFQFLRNGGRRYVAK